MSALCPENFVEDNQARSVQAGERSLIVVRKRGQLYLYENSCPHRSIPLEWVPDQFLDHEGHYLQCATHGALFKIEDGRCIAGPCVDDGLTPVPFEIREGQVYLR